MNKRKNKKKEENNILAILKKRKPQEGYILVSEEEYKAYIKQIELGCIYFFGIIPKKLNEYLYEGYALKIK